MPFHALVDTQPFAKLRWRRAVVLSGGVGAVELIGGAGSVEMIEGLSDTALFKQKLARLVIIGDAGLLHQHAYGAVGDLVVDEQDIDHLVVFHPAQLDHGGRADHVEEHLLRGATLHTRAAGNEFRAGEDLYGKVRGGGDGRAGIADDTTCGNGVPAATLKRR